MSDMEITPQPQPIPKRWRSLYPLFGGVLVGILLRLLYGGKAGDLDSPMGAGFILGAPFAISAVAVYMAERRGRRTLGYHAWLGAQANALAVLGTLLIMIEGLICAIIIVPLFMLLGAVGGVLMGLICRGSNWPRSTTYSFVALPLLLTAILPAGSGDHHIGHSMRSVVIHAAPEQVWQQLHHTTTIAPTEVDKAWMYRIGVPMPQSGITRREGDTLVRDIRMGKAIHFSQVASEWRENSYVKWRYRFAPDSVPPRALDDHVKIGGHYFDVIDTIYTLTPHAQGTTLTISMHYRVSTQFNWYATAVADLLFDNFEKVILDFYARRAEAASSLPARSPASPGSTPPAALQRT